MDKLTKRAEYHCACWNGDQKFSTHKRYMELLDRLAAYEDIDLMPEEIVQLKEWWRQIPAKTKDEIKKICGNEFPQPPKGKKQ